VWTKEEVYQWAKNVGLDEQDANILKQQKVDGKVLLTLTEEKLLKILPFGSATNLASAIKTLRNEWAKRIACMRNTQTNTHLSYNI
jgi:hypothetical protein